MRVLFQPARPVQARELNTIQSILQNQVEKFANHIFQNGSRVSEARAASTPKAYVRLESTAASPFSGTIDLSPLTTGMIVRGGSSNLSARLVKGINAENDDPPTIYVVYTNTAIDGETSAFLAGEVITFYDDNNVEVYSATVKCPGCVGSSDLDTINPTGTGIIFYIDAGVWYFEGMFLENTAQDVVVSKYGEVPTAKIGFDFVQTILTSDDDTSLLDNSLGYPNQTAPGADRYKIDLTLTKRSLSVDDGEDYIRLATYNEGIYEYLKSDAEYADIADEWARRTYETNGNYTVTPYKLRFIEDKADSLTDASAYSIYGDEDSIQVVISPGIAYIRGYRHQNLIERYVKAEKARDTAGLYSYLKLFDERTFIHMKPATGYSAYPNDADDPNAMDGTVVQAYDGPLTAGNPTGNLLGTFKVYDTQYVSGTINALAGAGAGEFDLDGAEFKYYIYDISMVGDAKLSDAQSFTDLGGTNGFRAVAAADDTAIYYPGKSELIWKIDKENIKTIRSYDNRDDPDPPGSTAITLRKKVQGTLNSLGQVTFTSYTNEYFQAFDARYCIGIMSDNDAGAGIYHTVDLTIGSRITITSTSVTVDLGTSIDIGGSSVSTPGNSITLILDVLRVNAKEDSKEYAEVTLTGQSPSTADILTGVSDAFELVEALQYNETTPAVPGDDISEYFTLVSNDKDSVYDESYIDVDSTISIPGDPNIKWQFKVAYYDHNRSANLGFFTVDSYRDLISNGDVSYEDRPSYTATNKNDYPLYQSFDFRPGVIGGSITNATVPKIGSTALFDVEYYLARIDLVQINKWGEFYLKKGTPTDSPIPPREDEMSMVLYEVYFDPYTYDVKTDIRKKHIDNKRYTMQDIGRLENRIRNLEYYTTLTLLEKTASDMSIKDSSGLDRFKNGLVADNFSDFQASDLTSSDFKAGLDRRQRELRPSFTPRSKALVIDETASNARYLGAMAMIDFDEYMIDEQPFATKHISINPYFQYKKLGQMVVVPNTDVWADIEREPDLVIDVDVGADAINTLAEKSGILKTEWGAWQTTNSTVVGSSSSTSTSSGSFANTTGTYATTSSTTTTTTTTELDQQREGIKTTFETRVDTYDLGDRVTDVSIIAKMRSTEVQFFATKMKANTKVWAFFDGIPVSDHVRPLVDGTPGDQLITDEFGQIAGIFIIPEDTFFTGTREFYITSDEGLTGDDDLETTAAKATFFAGGLDVSKQQTTMNVTVPMIVEEEVQEEQTITVSSSSSTSTSSSTRTGPGVPPPAPPPRPPRPKPCSCKPPPCDPVAQSFKLPNDCFITSIDVYFAAIDPNESELFCQIKNMVNGYPGPIVLGEKKFLSSDLVISEDSTTPFNMKFPFPVYVRGDEEYCFVVGGYSPDTRIYVSKLGGEVVDQPGKIVEQQPSLGSSFRSQNNSTWNAEQYEDIKYKIYIAQFKSRELDLTLYHQPDGRVKLSRDPFEAESGESTIRVYVDDHGLLQNDKATISLFEDTWIQLSITGDGIVNIGQTITTVGGFQGEIKNIRVTSGVTEVQFKDTVGRFSIDDDWYMGEWDKVFADNYLIAETGLQEARLSSTGTIRYNAAAGTFLTEFPTTLNGIPTQELNKQHTVQLVDSMDTFIIEVSTNADTTGRFGGEDSAVYINEKYEMFNVSGEYMPYDSTEVWSYRGIGHNPINGSFVSENYSALAEKAIQMKADHHLGQPHKLVSNENSSSGTYLVKVTGSFVAPTEWLSPMVNLNTFSMITVSNRVEWVDSSAQLDVVPNATGRFASESDPLNGSENYKYVTRTINLETPASDLVVLFDLYKDIDGDFDVWIKLVAPYEGVDIDSKRWMRVSGIDKTYNSSNLVDRVEYEITMSDFEVDVYTDNDTFTTVAWDALPNDQFGSFKIKLVAKTKNPAKPPIFKNFRAIAVT
jgi:hypothetical protein